MEEQARIVRGADVVAGFAGSALMHIALTGGPRTVFALLSETYHAANELHLADLVGHDLTLVVSRPDVPRAATRFDAASYRSSFRFDFAREGVGLDAALRRLG